MGRNDLVHVFFDVGFPSVQLFNDVNIAQSLTTKTTAELSEMINKLIADKNLDFSVEVSAIEDVEIRFPDDSVPGGDDDDNDIGDRSDEGSAQRGIRWFNS